MKRNKLSYAIWISSLLTCSVSHASLIITGARCAIDSLPQWTHDLDPAHNPVTADPTGSARGRNAWLKVCNPANYSFAYPDSIVKGIDAEFDTFIASTGHKARLYPTFGYITSYDASGMPNYSNALPDPANKAKNIAWTAPTVAPTTSGANECALPANFYFVGLCTSGCVTPEQQITTPGRSEAIADLESNADEGVSVPGFEEAGAFSLKSFGIKSFVKDIMPAQQKVLTFTTQSGGTVRVSLTHPLLNGDYKMVPASQFAVGESLVRSNGDQDHIVSIEQSDYMGKLHNLYVDTANMSESMYIVQGFISGDKRYQDIGVSDINRQALRKLVQE